MSIPSSNKYARQNKLAACKDWYLKADHNQILLNKERLTAPYVIKTLNSLPKGWRNFAHMVHRDIYENFDYFVEFENLDVREYGEYDELDVAKEWQRALTEMDKRLSDLPPKLFYLIVSHL